MCKFSAMAGVLMILRFCLINVDFGVTTLVVLNRKKNCFFYEDTKNCYFLLRICYSYFFLVKHKTSFEKQT